MQPSTEDPEDAIQFSIHRKSVLQLWTNPDQTEEQIGSTESCKVGVQLPVPKRQGRYRLVNNMIEQLKFKKYENKYLKKNEIKNK